jgi:hypothetical protein
VRDVAATDEREDQEADRPERDERDRDVRALVLVAADARGSRPVLSFGSAGCGALRRSLGRDSPAASRSIFGARLRRRLPQ